ncbi:MAG: CheA signal transduction histidine kinase [Clostridia bacterium]|jgi:two-component system chemotaxis sensor kinase CheA|nr:CheA signal transduction histidine kinase [Clostridia bacterium]
MDQLSPDNVSEFSTVNRKNLDELVSLVEELVINKVKIEKMKNEFSNSTQAKILDQELRIISEIQESIKKVRLIKIKTISKALSDLVDQYSKDYCIHTQFLFNGQETQIENSLISYIHNLLAYFIKDIFEKEFVISDQALSQISISAQSDGKDLTTIIESNGKGFDAEKICNVLNKKDIDLLSFSEDEVRKFISLTSSSDNIDYLLKLRQDLLHLGGSLKFESELNTFRRITIVIPMSSSIMQGLLVTIGNQVYAIPLEFIETILDKKSVKIKKSHRSQMILHMEHVIRLINVSDLLQVETSEEPSCILIVNSNNSRAALLVDSLLDQTDMVIKNKPPIIKDVNEIKGTTILGDGLVTLVLDIPSILKEI